jgi:hypothetical protein
VIELQHEAKLLLEELEGLRDLENKLFSNEK